MKSLKTIPIWVYVALFFAIAPLAMLPLFDVDEGAFSEATREMVASGNYVTTFLYHIPRFDKPVAIYWLQALSSFIFGMNAFAMRFPSVCASAVWLYVMYQFMKRYYNTSMANISALMFLGSVQIHVISKCATADALLNMCLALSILSLWSFIEHASYRYLLLSYIIMGLGVLTKGPIALVIPFATLSLYAMFSSRYALLYEVFTYFKGWLGCCLIWMPWYILELYDQGWDFIDGFFMRHNVGRALSAMESHSGAWWYYVLVMIFGLLPFSAFLLPLVKHWRSVWLCPRQRFLAVWFMVVFTLFSAVSTKLPHYIIYGYTPLLMLMAMYAEGSWQQSIWTLLPLSFLVGMLCSIPLVLSYASLGITDPVAMEMCKELASLFDQVYLIKLLGSYALLLTLWWLPIAYDYRHTFLVIWLLGVINFLLLPKVSFVQQQPVYEAALVAKLHKKPVIMYKLHRPSFAFYSGVVVRRIQPQSGDIVVTLDKYLSDFLHYTIMYRRFGIALIKLGGEYERV